VEQVRVRTRVEGDAGVVSVRARATGGLDALEARLDGASGTYGVQLGRDGDELTGELRVPGVALWWPHTHGAPALHDLTLCDEQDRVLDARRVGFRSLAPGPEAGHDVEAEGIDLHVNGVRVFARGAVWTPADPVGLAPSEEELRAALEGVVDAGMNMLRVPGIGAYESDEFHDLCDELGLLVWQDFMFANLDYPVADDAFWAAVEAEAAQQLERLAPRPSLAVLCGNSEVEQQAAMVGLEPGAGRGPLFGEILPALVSAHGADAVWVPSAPCGGDLPFRTDRGVANYYGVGAYLRPVEDARRADVRFAAECLAFSNVPDPAGVEAVMADAPLDVVVHHPRWKAGVPRDAGAGWDFEDVRDHYLRLLYEVDPVALRSSDHERYLELSRAVTGEVMAEVFGEWRRAGSPCGGGLVLWLRDLVPGAGWGVVDRDGVPKAAYHHLRRALAPRAVWTTDEGLNGIDVHVANDAPEPLEATLRVALYRDGTRRVDEASEALAVAPHQVTRRGVEEMVGRFADVSWSYRFGPPAQDVVVATLEGAEENRPLSQAFRFPAGRPLDRSPAAALGLTAGVDGADAPELVLESAALAYGVRVSAPGFLPADDAFCLEPGRPRRLALRATKPGTPFTGAAITAINAEGRLRVPPPS
jgi:beta-mannosidase